MNLRISPLFSTVVMCLAAHTALAQVAGVAKPLQTAAERDWFLATILVIGAIAAAILLILWWVTR